MISAWLAGRSLSSFKAEHFGREPFVQPDSASAARPLLSWDTLDRLLDARPGLFVVREGRPHPGRDPARATEAMRLFADGWSLVLRGCEEHDDGLSQLAGTFEDDFGGDVQVQVFATPAGFRSFGWHYDCEDVFIAQTEGSKEYRLRRNTVNPEPTIDAMPRDMHFERESAPVVACTLVAGDWLYIPRGFWHVGRALSDSLGISTGVLVPSARGSRPPRERSAVRRARRAAGGVPAGRA